MQSDDILLKYRLIHDSENTYFDIEILDVKNKEKYIGNSRTILISTRTGISTSEMTYWTNFSFKYSIIKINELILEKYKKLCKKQQENGKYIFLNELISSLSLEEYFI